MEQTRHLWYVKREGRQAGPFPEAAIAEDALLGRLPVSAEISGDGVTWNPLSAVTRLDSRIAPRSAQVPYWGDVHLNGAVVPPHWAEVPPNGADVPPNRADVPLNWISERADALRRWADQRSGRDRRTAERGIAHAPRRSGDERRRHPAIAPRHPAAVRTPPSALNRAAQRWLMLAGVLAAVLLAATGARYGPVNPISVDIGVAARQAQ
jgi:hypothetical protein